MVCPVLSTLYLARKYAHEEESYWRDMMDIQSEVYEETTMGVVDGHSRWMIYKSLWVLNMKVEIMRPGVSQSEMVMSHSSVAITKPYTIEFSL
jgi:ADP-glucose pyrophosphorylase